MDALEHLQYAIPKGFYRVRLTYSPTFKEVLPILDGILGYAQQPHNGIRRTGISIHAGNTIADTLKGVAEPTTIDDEAPRNSSALGVITD